MPIFSAFGDQEVFYGKGCHCGEERWPEIPQVNETAGNKALNASGRKVFESGCCIVGNEKREDHTGRNMKDNYKNRTHMKKF